jgi:hypothetical protein
LKSKQLAQWSDGTLRIPDLKGLGDIALLEDLVAPKRPIM